MCTYVHSRKLNVLATLLQLTKKSQSMKLNQQRIADELGISRTTVSRCFTNHPGINPDTRAAVFALASKLGYTYLKPRNDDKAKSASSKTMAVLICSDLQQNILEDAQSPGMQLLPGISEYALINQIKLDIKILNPIEIKSDVGAYQALLREKRRSWDGVLLIYPFPSQFIEDLMTKFPCVSLVEQFGAPNLDCIDVDHHRGISHLMQMMIDRGHRRIGFFSRRYSVEALWVYRRYSAYVEKLARSGLPYRSEDILNLFSTDDYSLEESYQRAIQQIHDGVTAWVCPADHIAYDFIRVLRQRGLVEGKDYSITGFDGISREGDRSSLTTVQIPYREIGYQAARRLSDLLENRYNTTQHVYLNGEVLEGRTCLPVLQGASR